LKVGSLGNQCGKREMRLEILKTLTWKLLLLHIYGEVLGIWTLMGVDEILVGGNKFFLLKFLGIVH
jgi:hypothetical protein